MTTPGSGVICLFFFIFSSSPPFCLTYSSSCHLHRMCLQMNGFLLKMGDGRGFKFALVGISHWGLSLSLSLHTLHIWLSKILEGLQEYVTLLSISQQAVAFWDIMYWCFIALIMYCAVLIFSRKSIRAKCLCTPCSPLLGSPLLILAEYGLNISLEDAQKTQSKYKSHGPNEMY